MGLIPIGIEPDSRKVKASSSFLRKRTKKLLLIGVRVGSSGRLKLQKFLLLFSKEALSCLPRVNLNAAWYKSGKLLGRNRKVAPRASMASRTPATFSLTSIARSGIRRRVRPQWFSCPCWPLAVSYAVGTGSWAFRPPRVRSLRRGSSAGFEPTAFRIGNSVHYRVVPDQLAHK